MDACLGGVRNAGPAGSTLDLNFMFPGSLDPRITFTRASTAPYTDINGVTQTAAVNQPRWDYDSITHVLKGLLLEEAVHDRCVISPANMAPWFVSPGGTWLAELIYSVAPIDGARVIHATGAAGARSPMFAANPGFAQWDGSGSLTNANRPGLGAIAKVVSTWAPGTAKVCVNAGAVATSAALTIGYDYFVTSGISLMISAVAASESLTGHLRRVRYWPRALSDTEMQQVTT